MALTLRGSINATQTYAEVLGSDDLAPNTIRSLDSEYVYVRSVSTGIQRWADPSYRQVTLERGFLGTTAASHTLGTSFGAVDLATGGGGGGAAIVTDGTTDVTATTIQMPPGGVVDAGSGTARLVTTSLLGPYPVSFDDAGFVNPDDNGPEILTVPSGVLVEFFPITTTVWAGAGTDDLLYLALNAVGESSGLSVGAWSILESNVAPSLLGEALLAPVSVVDPPSGANTPARVYMPIRVFTQATSKLYASIGAAGTLTAGSADIYALVTVPAS